MKMLPTGTILLLIILSPACGQNVNTVDANTDRDSKVRRLHDSAFNAKTAGASPEIYINMQQETIDEMRRNGPSDMSVEVLSQMGYFLCRSGRYIEGLMLLQEATDSLRHAAPGLVDPQEEARLLGNTANLYSRIGLYKDALELNRQAIDKTTGSNSAISADLWRMRATTYEHLGQYDSMFHCLETAMEASGQIAEPKSAAISRVQVENQISHAIIEHPGLRPDDVAHAVKSLENNVGRRKSAATDSMLIGRGYFLSGSREKGLKIMKQALEFNRNKGFEDYQWALSILSESIIENELSPGSLKTYNESRRLTDTINQQRTADALLHADFKYRTSQLKNEKLLLETEKRYTRQHIFLWSVTATMVILALTLLTLRIINNKNRKLRENKRAIEQLLDSRIELNRQIELLNEKIKEQYIPSETLAAEQPDNRIFSIAILKREDEDRFRQLFSSVFPGLIERIRTRYPDMSPSAELIMMLIRLQKSNSEIAFALGIKRESVAKARYRLRSLFGLDKETDLNDFIKEL